MKSWSVPGLEPMRSIKPRSEKRAWPLLLLLLTILGVWSGDAMAITKYARVAGNWSTVGTWSLTSCAVAGATTGGMKHRS